ncbi:MAG: hypothetical protein KKF62_15495 [Bacteroidetes bacterium]|nr:hypothetical protein [Bacteroidota bacterium]MBU1114699.1 hypothetical protein [Bacteroidota bacterium]MBU1798901.1 hypothetical protein [Bacteroidota bacterium]
MHTKLKIIKIFTFVILLFLLFSCSKKEEKNYVVKVGNYYLTEADITEELGFTNNIHKFREEFIREWIEKHLIYLDAKKSGVINSVDYKNIIAKSKVEIANALIIKNMISENSVHVEKKEIEDFYVNNIAKFKVTTPVLVFNQVSFTDRNIAVEFLHLLIGSNWENTIENFAHQKSKISLNENRIEYVYNILQENLKEEILMLEENEFSRIVEVSHNTFTIVQLKKRYNKNDVPKFEEIKEEVEQKYLSLKRKELYDNYLNKLFSEYGSEIER